MESDNRFDVDLAAEMKSHQITDSDGLPLEETETVPSDEKSANSDENVQVEETSKPEKEKTETDIPDLVEDESTGKKYVPQERFNEIYAKFKQLQRQKPQEEVKPTVETAKPSSELSVGTDKTAALETEMLITTMPEFDRNNPNYSEQLDKLGAMFYREEPGITKLGAARKAKEFLKALASSQETVRTETRNFKSVQADTSVASRSSGRGVTQVDPNNMSLEEMEDYLRKNGQW